MCSNSETNPPYNSPALRQDCNVIVFHVVGSAELNATGSVWNNMEKVNYIPGAPIPPTGGVLNPNSTHS